MSEAIVTFVPIVVISAILLTMVAPALAKTETVQRLKARLEGRCYHDYEEFACRRKWGHCSVCAIELCEPFNYHPVVLSKCSKCGAETTEFDNSETRTLPDYVQIEEMTEQ